MTDYAIGKFPLANFRMEMGDNPSFRLYFSVKKTILNQIKYWLFCQFFPFKIIEWGKEK